MSRQEFITQRISEKDKIPIIPDHKDGTIAAVYHEPERAIFFTNNPRLFANGRTKRG